MGSTETWAYALAVGTTVMVGVSSSSSKKSWLIARNIRSIWLVRRDIEVTCFGMVYAPFQKIVVDSNSIVGYQDNYELINIQLKMLDVQLRTLQRELQEQIMLENEQEHIEIDVKEYKQIIDDKLKFIDLNYSKIKSIVEECKKNIRIYNKKLKDQITQKSEVVDFIQKTMFECAQDLDVKQYIEKNGIFTNKIQKNSGAISYKIIISFRIAFILSIEKFKNIKLPLIIDSLRNGELDEDNSKKILSVIEKKLIGHQVIVASIFEYENFFDGKEIIKERLIPIK